MRNAENLMETLIIILLIGVIIILISRSDKPTRNTSIQPATPYPSYVYAPEIPKPPHVHITSNIELSEEQKKYLELLEYGTEYLFITGKAGTGKSTLIREYYKATRKKTVILSPTGIAALNAGGQTIHSFFRFPTQFIRDDPNIIKNLNLKELYRNCDEFIIDEISMVRADLLDGIDIFLRKNGRNRELPFGGARMIFVGDPFQLPPVTKPPEKELFTKPPYGISKDKEPYFFKSKAYQTIQKDLKIIELSEPQRQQDKDFLQALDLIRTGKASYSDLTLLNQNVQPDYTTSLNDGIITLTPTNARARKINEDCLNEINSALHTYNAKFTGDFLNLKRKQTADDDDNDLPANKTLYLKKGARVMFLKNDSSGKRWVNGTTGTVTECGDTWVKVRIDGNANEYYVEPATWERLKYEWDRETGTIKTDVIGTMTQIPLRLAWAVTIHKSQGLTFERQYIDFSSAPFAHGQVYVALSRCKSLEGLYLSREIGSNDNLVDSEITEFYNQIIERKIQL